MTPKLQLIRRRLSCSLYAAKL